MEAELLAEGDLLEEVGLGEVVGVLWEHLDGHLGVLRPHQMRRQMRVRVLVRPDLPEDLQVIASSASFQVVLDCSQERKREREETSQQPKEP